jgi:hypothetical protein
MFIYKFGVLCVPLCRFDAVMSDHLQPRGTRNAALLQALQTLTGV